MRKGHRRLRVWLVALGLLPMALLGALTPAADSMPPQDGFEAQGVFRDPLASPGQPIIAATSAPADARAPNASFVGTLSGTLVFTAAGAWASGGFTGHPAVALGGGGNCLDVTILGGRLTDDDPERVAELTANYRIRPCASSSGVVVGNVLVQIYSNGLISSGPAGSGASYPTPRLVPTTVTTTSVVPPTLPPTPLASDPLHDGELNGFLFVSNIVSPCPDPVQPANHCRAEGDLLDAAVDLVARRPADGGPREELMCVATGTGGANLPFRARQDLAQGRGFLGPANAIEGPGILTRDLDAEDVSCRALVSGGVFHRVGTAAYGRLRLTVEGDV